LIEESSPSLFVLLPSFQSRSLADSLLSSLSVSCSGLHRRQQLVLFQGSQVVAGQVTVAILKAWARRVKAKNERLLLEAEAPSGPSGELEGDEKRESGDVSSRSHPEAGRSGEVEEDVTRTTTPVFEVDKKAAV